MIGCASGQVVLDRSHPEFLGGTKLTHNVGELQAMCCAVLWLIEQNRIDDSMQLEFRFDSEYAAAAAVGTQRCSSNTELAHKLRHVRGHKGDPWRWQTLLPRRPWMAVWCQAPERSWRMDVELPVSPGGCDLGTC